MDSAMSLTSFSNLYMGSSVNSFYPLDRNTFMHFTGIKGIKKGKIKYFDEIQEYHILKESKKKCV